MGGLYSNLEHIPIEDGPLRENSYKSIYKPWVPIVWVRTLNVYPPSGIWFLSSYEICFQNEIIFIKILKVIKIWQNPTKSNPEPLLDLILSSKKIFLIKLIVKHTVWKVAPPC